MALKVSSVCRTMSAKRSASDEEHHASLKRPGSRPVSKSTSSITADLAFGLLKAILIMTFSRMAAHQQNAVRTALEGLDDQARMNHPGAHHTNDPQTGGILDPNGAREIGRGVCAPVARESQNLRFESHIVIRQLQFLRLSNINSSQTAES